jgi:hypothetical protein|tara:strand:- start:347 stop:1111 length:765 start_codon:yes stop_codon:yes gene_type:complete
MKTVYYSIAPYGGIVDMSATNQFIGGSIQKVKKNYFDKLRKIGPNAQSFTKCVAATEYLKNWYSWHIDYGFNLKFNRDNNSFKLKVDLSDDPEVKNLLPGFQEKMSSSNFLLRGVQDRMVSVNHGVYFFCEEDLWVEQMHPTYESTEFSRNTMVFPGSYNIAKWFRPLQSSFMCLEDNIRVNEGDGMYYFKFLTTEQVKLVEFDFTQEIANVAFSSTSYKVLRSFLKLDKLYDLFSKKRAPQKLAKLIKQNIIE